MLQQLSALDASFLYQDTPHTPMHVGAIALLDPSTSPYGPLTLEAVTAYFDERLHLMPTARRRLVNVPFGMDHPYWVEDENFDLEYHIREVGLPEPHDWRQFYTLGARILSRPLDLTRPLWETYIIHGLDNLEGIPKGCVGLMTKTHHCAIDGASGMEMAMALADLTPEMTPVNAPKEPWRPDPMPTDTELLLRTWGNNLQRPTQMAELLAQTLPATQALSRTSRAELPSAQTPVPVTRFNRPVTAHRVIGFERFRLDEVRAMKNEVEGATVNDVALSICGGALRLFLEEKLELPEDPLLAMAPISVRKSNADYSMGNQVSAMFVGIGTNLQDPVERLVKVHANTSTAKQMTNAIGADLLTRYGDFVPAAVSNMAQRLTSEFSRANQSAPAFNCSITNVPGPQVPLYTMGCRTITTIGYGPIVHNMGLIIPISSYFGEFTISFTSCREMIPDPDLFMRCIRDSFAETKDALLGSDAEAKVASIAKNYEHLAEAALAEIRAVREKAEA
ncbi:MAG: wax ester/triacylglycerol synthase family O-acyltransferase [Gammaproteobacteria bacterium]|nr:wax ester/triacylglycerol synthase family O-acyltransferase [Gammaproteobacteria bacterium]